MIDEKAGASRKRLRHLFSDGIMKLTNFKPMEGSVVTWIGLNNVKRVNGVINVPIPGEARFLMFIIVCTSEAKSSPY